MRFTYLVVSMLLFATSASATEFLFAQPNASAPAQITLSIGSSVKIGNATPGGSVVLFSAARTSRQGRTHVTRQALMLADENGDGIIEFTPEVRIPMRSVWIAVDYLTGAVAAGAPVSFPLTVSELTAGAYRNDADGTIAQLEKQLRRLTLLLVRPGNGAWTAAARDGDEPDADKTRNARVAIAFGAARPIRGSPAAPRGLKRGDVIVAIDPTQLDVYIGRIDR
jgi:hypothetical protein